MRKEEEHLSRETVEANAGIAHVKRNFTTLRQKVYELNKWKRKLEAVGVTPQCYLRRLQERIEFVNAELISVHKNQILCEVWRSYLYYSYRLSRISEHRIERKTTSQLQ